MGDLLGVRTTGNATLIAHDGIPVLVTDPWLGNEYSAYFGSWTLSYEIAEEARSEISQSKFVWFSHGHPDHLNGESLKHFRGKTVLLPDHYGGRILKGLLSDNYDVAVMPDRRWMQLSSRIRTMCITTDNQDAVLLLDVNGRLFINLNDAGTRHCKRFIQDIARNFKSVTLLALSGYGDADMINFYDSNGTFVPPKIDLMVGDQLSNIALSVGATAVSPFSSFHNYQRSDSIWAQEYVTDIDAYSRGINPALKFVKAFSFHDCANDEIVEIVPVKAKIETKRPEEFGDDWSEGLMPSDLAQLENYMRRKERAANILAFVNFRVGKKDNIIRLNGTRDRGITFEAPRHSLMTAIDYRIFDDLLIGNFMKTTLHNMQSLYDHGLNQIITKYADNGGAETETQLKDYFRHYHEKSGRAWIRENFVTSTSLSIRRLVGKNDSLFRFGRRLYYKMK